MDITAYLNHQLRPYGRVPELTALADHVAQQPVADVLTDLRRVLATRALTGEDVRRLHVLLSQLHHAQPAIGPGVMDRLRRAVTTTQRGGEGDVLRKPGLPQDGLLDRPEAATDPA